MLMSPVLTVVCGPCFCLLAVEHLINAAMRPQTATTTLHTAPVVLGLVPDVVLGDEEVLPVCVMTGAVSVVEKHAVTAAGIVVVE